MTGHKAALSQSSSHPDSSYLIHIATITGVHGVRGDVKLHCLTEDPASIADYRPLLREDGSPFPALTLKHTKDHTAIVALAGVRDRTQAESWRQVKCYIPREALPPAEEGIYYCDLVGLTAYNLQGERLGVVTQVANYGAGDILEIAEDTGETLLLPFACLREHLPDRVVLDVPEMV
jgi:16S rRNA processing protein RimM